MLHPNQMLLTFYIFYHTYLVLTRRFVEKLRLMSLKKSHPSLYFLICLPKSPNCKTLIQISTQRISSHHYNFLQKPLRLMQYLPLFQSNDFRLIKVSPPLLFCLLRSTQKIPFDACSPPEILLHWTLRRTKSFIFNRLLHGS